MLSTVDMGWVISELVGKGVWYQGNWEFLVEAFGGSQYHPNSAYLAGATALLRYDFATGTRWTPFLTVGAGASATDIRNGDLSTTFEFNLQGGGGVHYFLTGCLSLTAQYKLIHLSNAGLRFPNLGVNSSTFLFGVSWFF